MVVMDITEKDVKEFQDLYKSKFGKELDYQTARKKLTMLVLQVKTVYQPITKKQIDDLVIRDKRKEDAEALARLIYDIYKEKKGTISIPLILKGRN